MATPGWTPDALAELLTDPPGTWRHPGRYRPDLDAGAEDLINAHSALLQSGDEPVVHVVAVTPVEGGDPVKWESWYLPVEGGTVDWTDGGYPSGRATIDVAGHLTGRFAPGPAPTGGRAAAQGPTPALSPSGAPWCLLPFGTLVSVYRGWSTPTGPEGVRLFDGVVVSSSYDRPGRRWTLECADLTHLLDRTAPRWGTTVAEVVAAAGGPDPDAPPTADDTLNTRSVDSYKLRTAITQACREAGEFWAPMPDTQLQWDEPSLFDVHMSGLPDGESVPAHDDIGMRSWLSSIEDWCDAAGTQARMAPGRKGRLEITRPDDPDRTSTTLTRLKPLTVQYTQAWSPAPNRLYLSYHRQQAPDLDGDIASAQGGEGATWTLSGNVLTVRPKDLTGPNIPQVQWRRSGDPDWRYIRVPLSVGEVQLVLDWGTDYYVGGADMHSDNDHWDEITISVPPQAEHVVHGFANRHTFANPSSVRRTGRITWNGAREVGRSRLTTLIVDPYSADGRAERMLRRVAGDLRGVRLDVKPLPWLMPGHTVKVDTGDGLAPRRHLVGEVSIPLEADQPMTVVTRDPDDADD